MKPEHPAPRQPGSPPATLTFLAGALIAGAALAAYHNSFSAPFEFDDIPTIVDNPTIRHLWNLKTVLSPPTGGYTVSGRPVVNLTLAINYALGGTNPWGYHATNLLIHIPANGHTRRHRTRILHRPHLDPPPPPDRVCHLRDPEGRIPDGTALPLYSLCLYTLRR